MTRLLVRLFLPRGWNTLSLIRGFYLITPSGLLRLFAIGSDLFFTFDPLEKAQRTLFLADKRLSAAQRLFVEGDSGRAVVTATKAEQYLELALIKGRDADVKGTDAAGFFETLFKASLTHRQMLEEMMSRAPEDGKPILNKTLDSPKKVNEQVSHFLNERGKTLLTPTPTN